MSRFRSSRRRFSILAPTLLGSVLAILAVTVHCGAVALWGAALVMFAAAVIRAAVNLRGSARRADRAPRTVRRSGVGRR